MEWRFLPAVAVGAAGCLVLGLLTFVVLTPPAVPDAPPAAPLLIARAEPPAVAIEPAPPSIRTDPGRAAMPTPSPQGNAPLDLDAPGMPRQIVPAPSRAMPAPPAPATSAVPPALSPVPAPTLALPAPPRPAPKPRPPVDHRYDGVLTLAEINRIKAALRLSPDQEAYWPPVAVLLRELGRQQMAQIDAGQKPDFNMSGEMTQRFYFAASPLLQSLREDQKDEVRKRARMMGLESFASYI